MPLLPQTRALLPERREPSADPCSQSSAPASSSHTQPGQARSRVSTTQSGGCAPRPAHALSRGCAVRRSPASPPSARCLGRSPFLACPALNCHPRPYLDPACTQLGKRPWPEAQATSSFLGGTGPATPAEPGRCASPARAREQGSIRPSCCGADRGGYAARACCVCRRGVGKLTCARRLRTCGAPCVAVCATRRAADALRLARRPVRQRRALGTPNDCQGGRLGRVQLRGLVVDGLRLQLGRLLLVRLRARLTRGVSCAGRVCRRGRPRPPLATVPAMWPSVRACRGSPSPPPRAKAKPQAKEDAELPPPPRRPEARPAADAPREAAQDAPRVAAQDAPAPADKAPRDAGKAADGAVKVGPAPLASTQRPPSARGAGPAPAEPDAGPPAGQRPGGQPADLQAARGPPDAQRQRGAHPRDLRRLRPARRRGAGHGQGAARSPPRGARTPRRRAVPRRAGRRRAGGEPAARVCVCGVPGAAARGEGAAAHGRRPAGRQCALVRAAAPLRLSLLLGAAAPERLPA